MTTRLLLLGVMLGVGGCRSKPVFPYDMHRPAQILTPVRHAGVIDGRARFREIFCERFEFHGGFEAACETYLHLLDDEPAPTGAAASARLGLDRLRVFIVGGYLGDTAPNDMKPFGPPVEHLREEGYRIEYVHVTGAGSSSQNAGMIADALREASVPEDERLVLVGYSKGTTDILHFLVEHPQEAAQVDGVVSFAGTVNGSPGADIVPEFLVTMIASGAEQGDKGGLDSIKRSTQMRWMAEHALPTGPQYFSIAAFTDYDNVSAILQDSYIDLAQLDPRNDSQVLFYDQVIPHSTLLGYANGDHWAIALPFTEEAKGFADTLMNRNEFPRLALFEAVLLFVRESL